MGILNDTIPQWFQHAPIDAPDRISLACCNPFGKWAQFERSLHLPRYTGKGGLSQAASACAGLWLYLPQKRVPSPSRPTSRSPLLLFCPSSLLNDMNSRKPMKEVQSRYAGSGRASADPSSEPLDVTRLMHSFYIEDKVAAIKEDIDCIAASKRERHENNSRTQEPPRDVIEDKHDRVPVDVTRLMHTLSIEDRVAALREDLDRIEASRRGGHENNYQTQEPPQGVTDNNYDRVPMDAQRYPAQETAENRRADMVGQEERRTPFDAGRTPHQPCLPYQPSDIFLSGHAAAFAPTPYATLPGLQHTQWRSTAVRGHQNSHTDSVINVNSGNTTTRTVTNSNNDSSIATYSRRGKMELRRSSSRDSVRDALIFSCGMPTLI